MEKVSCGQLKMICGGELRITALACTANSRVGSSAWPVTAASTTPNRMTDPEWVLIGEPRDGCYLERGCAALIPSSNGVNRLKTSRIGPQRIPSLNRHPRGALPDTASKKQSRPVPPGLVTLVGCP